MSLKANQSKRDLSHTREPAGSRGASKGTAQPGFVVQKHAARRLQGKKLKGEWTLVRTRMRQNAETPQWLLLKSGSDTSPVSKRGDDTSALSGRSFNQIASQVTAKNRDASRETKAGFVEPMKAQLAKELPAGPEWTYEIKFDGIRALAIKRGGETRLFSRTEKDITRKYPQVAEAVERLGERSLVLDGEIVALDRRGLPSFQLLQSYEQAGQEKPPLFYYVFDLLHRNGRDLTPLPLEQRKAEAESVLEGAPPALRFSSGIVADSARVLREMRKRGLEGLVAKRKTSRYESGRRSGAWVKFKWTLQQEFVVGGYTKPKGGRTHFGALLVGYYDGGRLLFAAKVGTGFDLRQLESLHAKFRRLEQEDCPFANLPERLGSAGRGLTARAMSQCTWLKPRLVAEIRFAEWTRDDHLRQPAFLGLREDKPPEEVVREQPA